MTPRLGCQECARVVALGLVKITSNPAASLMDEGTSPKMAASESGARTRRGSAVPRAAMLILIAHTGKTVELDCDGTSR